MNVYREIAQERQRQMKQWGGQQHDDQHNHGQWMLILAKQVGKAANGVLRWRDAGWTIKPLRDSLIAVAAVCVAWLEAIDRRSS